MFDSTEQEIRDRIRQSKEILSLIERLEGGNSAKLEKEAGEVDIIKIQKGIFFVSLYSSIEYSLTASSACFLTLLNKHKRRPIEYHKYMLCTILNSEFNSVRECGKKNLWEKKASFFDTLFSDDLLSIDAREGANKRGNSSRLTQSFHFFMFEPIFSPVNALNQPI
ncbi:hypothetical protein [Aeromonas caviae]|uniref:hypothetical protein n=1 Tax=Aeromonas caviae TaxID=648 RepID=UPI00259DDC35|nr:hypothetical protein [Aeromonas caviae]MDM5108872.1 hypothetical protein [Aeromonas caviae]